LPLPWRTGKIAQAISYPIFTGAAGFIGVVVALRFVKQGRRRSTPPAC
jgi:hypothetical protein